VSVVKQSVKHGADRGGVQETTELILAAQGKWDAILKRYLA